MEVTTVVLSASTLLVSCFALVLTAKMWRHQLGTLRLDNHKLARVGTGWHLQVIIQNVGSVGIDIEDSWISVLGRSSTSFPQRAEPGKSFFLDFSGMFPRRGTFRPTLRLRVATANGIVSKFRIKLDEYERGMINTPPEKAAPEPVSVAAPDEIDDGVTEDPGQAAVAEGMQ